mmetsp:Transcript_4341/g.6508  ORF Transcript_4341/g.6508 Transcript_4341/m.6508 type:complete len:250 (-) Transcript_4341:102-851(-)
MGKSHLRRKVRAYDYFCKDSSRVEALKRKELEGKDLPPTARDERPSLSFKRFQRMMEASKKLKAKKENGNARKQKKELLKTKQTRRKGESFGAFSRRINKARERAIREINKPLNPSVINSMKQDKKVRAKKRKRLEKHQKKKKRAKPVSIQESAEVSDEIVEKKNTPAFREVADRPPSFKFRPKARSRRPRAADVQNNVVESADDDDNENEEEAAAAKERMIAILRARAQLAYKNAKKRKSTSGVQEQE